MRVLKSRYFRTIQFATVSRALAYSFQQPVECEQATIAEVLSAHVQFKRAPDDLTLEGDSGTDIFSRVNQGVEVMDEPPG